MYDKILIGKRKGKSPLGRRRLRWNDDIRTYKKYGVGGYLNLIGS
jgi:hypothetical protein